METYRIENLIFAYPNRDKFALDCINLTIKQGDFVTICGPSGCGKTTLLRHLKPATAPRGQKFGAIYFEGKNLDNLPPRDAASKIGFVMQSPDNQIVTDKVWHELAFGLESLGTKQQEIRLRVAEMATFFGLQDLFHKPVAGLSGGQKQLLALASIMTMQPSVLILDEPTSQLDPIAASDFLSAVTKLNRDLGITIILTEHRLEEVFPISTQVIAMDMGRIVDLDRASPSMPTPMRIWAAAPSGEYPVTVREGAKWMSNQPVSDTNRLVSPPSSENPIAVILKDCWFRYEKNSPDVLRGLSFSGNFGEITAILGGNGTGKTTALSLMAGLLKPYRGKVSAADKVYALPQNPQSVFSANTVREELFHPTSEDATPDIIKLCRLEGLLNSHPYDLSGGEQQRAALAKVLQLQPKILLLDEPTKGLDAEYKQIFAAILRKLADSGAAIIIVSHDIEFCAEYTDHCAMFFDGSIVTEGTPRDFFAGNSFYTTAANRMSRHVVPGLVTVADVVQAIGGKLPPPPKIPKTIKSPDMKKHEIEGPSSTNRLNKRTLLAAAMIFLSIPLTIYLGMNLLDDRRFYFISLLIILQTMIPFALAFESRKPKARELVIIAVLCAIAVAGRAALFMLPQFKPIIAFVIIAGVAFGGEAGFLVGAMTGFLSNMFFGQGPWTPWQMFAFGIIGFLAGVLFRKGLLKRERVTLSVFGGLATIFIYGGIMNPASVLIFQPSPTPDMFLAAFLYGLPFDILHAISTIVFLLVISKPMLEKLDRIKVKYGLNTTS